jgi:DNA-binding Lrp family transcriptional regulator
MNKEEWREFREALETQRLIVRRMVSGEALARVRILGIFNPGMRRHKPLSAYLHPCEALLDTWIFSDPPDITRWDIFLPFSSHDVPKTLIARARPHERPIPDAIFIRHLLWAWSRRPDQVHYEEGAKRLIEEEAERFIEIYSLDTLPIIHLGYRDVITTVSVAYATLLHSTDPSHDQVIVKREHVERAVAFLERMIRALELPEYKAEEEGRWEITAGEAEEIIADLDEKALGILNALKSGPKTSEELAELLAVSIPTVKRRYGVLRRHGLIKTTTGQGVSLTIRGINFVKTYLSRESGIKVSKSDTNTPSLVSKIDTMTPSPHIPPSENRPTLQERLDVLLDFLAVERSEEEIEEAFGPDGIRLLRILYREGRAYQPKPGRWKTSQPRRMSYTCHRCGISLKEDYHVDPQTGRLYCHECWEEMMR